MQPDLGFGLAITLAPILFFCLWLIARAQRKKHRERADIAELNLRLANEALVMLREKYARPIDLERRIASLATQKIALESSIETLQARHADKRASLSKLKAQVAIYDDTLAFAELGVYHPHFDFKDSEAYRAAITGIRDRQKAMVGAKEATIADNNWMVDGSRSKGKTLMNRQIRLTLRAFNGEADMAIANARWNNVVAMEKRILNAADQINAANESTNMMLNKGYVALKIDELHLTHEYREQLKIEKDERAEQARVEHDEEMLKAEAAAAARKETDYAAQLDRARLEGGADLGRFAELEAQLAAAHAENKRAQAMARFTSCGYVYVLSNVGSFGEDVVKIGLTRRLDPKDRVKELGDASVPFTFDTHAMIYSDQAPALEHALHTHFADRRINMANSHKEFFRVSLDEVQEAVSRLAPGADFFKHREAQEWQETLARRSEPGFASPPASPDSSTGANPGTGPGTAIPLEI